MNTKLILAALLSLVAVEISQIETSSSAPKEKTEQKLSSTSANTGKSDLNTSSVITVKRNAKGYDPKKAPAVLMPVVNHRATFGVYTKWRAQMRQLMGGRFSWKKVTEAEMRRLSEKMFDAAYVPLDIRNEYWAWFARMRKTLSR